MRNASVPLALVLILASGCKGGDGDGGVEPPRGVDVLDNRIRTPNVAAAVCGWLFDNDQDGEVDGSLGRITVVGTTWSAPCEIVEDGNPPNGQTLELIKMEVQFSDLPWEDVVANGESGDALWNFEQTYVADGTDENRIEVDAWDIVDGEAVLEAGGPPLGDVTLLSQDENGLHLQLTSQIAFVNHAGGESESASPPQDFFIDWEEVPQCPSACDEP